MSVEKAPNRTQSHHHTGSQPQPGNATHGQPTGARTLAVGTPAERVISKVEYKDNVKPSIKVKPKESDYSGTTAKILSQALLRYQIKIQTEDAFPSHETQQLWARTVFGQSCKEYEREYGTEGEHINRIYRLVRCFVTFLQRL